MPGRILTASFALLALLAMPAAGQDLLVASRGSDRILMFDADGNLAGVFAAGASVPSPSCLAVGPDGSVYAGIREPSGWRGVVRWNPGGSLAGRFAAQGLGDLTGVAVDAGGAVYAGGTSGNEVVRWNPDRTFYGTFAYGNGLAMPAGLAFGSGGKLFVASPGSGQVLVWNPDGTFDRVFRSFGASAQPVDVGLAGDGRVYVLLRLTGGQTGVGVYTSGGSFVRFHSGGSVMPSPTGLALRPGDDAVFVSDSSTGLLRLGEDGTFRVVAPAGASGLLQASAVRFRPAAQVSENSLLVQGKLTAPDGAPVPDASYQMRFGFYAQAAGGAPLWVSPAAEVQTRSGVFVARLEQVPATLFARDSLWLETTLGGTALSPRQLLGSQPSAVRAASAAALRAPAGGAAVFQVSQRPALTLGAGGAFTALASGGAVFATAFDASGQASAGPRLAPGSGSWSTLSDASAKRLHSPVDPEEVLRRLSALPVSRWRYRAQPGNVFHLGPMADDFRRAFDVGEGDGLISTVDADGVAMAALQGLLKRVAAQEETIRRLEGLLKRLEEGGP